MGYNVTRKPIGKAPSDPLASDPGNKLHSLILIVLAINGGQVKIKREYDGYSGYRINIYAVDSSNVARP